MAMGPFSAFQQALNSGLVPQPPELSATGRAMDRMRRAEGQRTKREVSEQARYAAASRHVDKVANTDLRAAREMSERARSTPNAGIIEPHSKPRIYGDSARSQTPNPVVEPVNSLPGERSRAGAYEAYGKYLEHLRRASAWNGAVHAYRLPLPTVDLNPVGDDFRQITHDPYYATRPHEALRYNTPDDSNYSKHFDTTYMGDAPILSNHPVYTDKDLYGRPIPVRIGAQNPFEVNPSPYTFSEFAKAMRSRMGGQ